MIFKLYFSLSKHKCGVWEGQGRLLQVNVPTFPYLRETWKKIGKRKSSKNHVTILFIYLFIFPKFVIPLAFPYHTSHVQTVCYITCTDSMLHHMNRPSVMSHVQTVCYFTCTDRLLHHMNRPYVTPHVQTVCYVTCTDRMLHHMNKPYVTSQVQTVYYITCTDRM